MFMATLQALVLLLFFIGGQSVRVVKGKGKTSIPETTSHILMSWRIDPSAPYLVTAATRISDEPEEDLTRVEWPLADREVKDSSSTEEYSREISMSLGVEASYGAFSMASQLSLESVSSERHQMFRRVDNSKFSTHQITSDLLDPVKRLNEATKKRLLNEPVEKIHEEFGDFFATKVLYGGVAQATYITTLSDGEQSSTVRAEMSASYSGLLSSARASLSVGSTMTYKSSKRSFQAKMAVRGGDPTILMRQGDWQQLKEQWSKTFNETNQFPVKMDLRPLWILLDSDDMNRQKSTELKAHMLQAWSWRLPVYSPKFNWATAFRAVNIICRENLWSERQNRIQAQERCEQHSECMGLTWHNNDGGDGRTAVSGLYQGCRGYGIRSNEDWDLIVIPQDTWLASMRITNKRCQQVLWNGRHQTRIEAQEWCERDHNCIGLMWYNGGGGDGRTAVSGWYQGCGGFVNGHINYDWDTIVKPKDSYTAPQAWARCRYSTFPSSPSCPMSRSQAEAFCTSERRCLGYMMHPSWNGGCAQFCTGAEFHMHPDVWTTYMKIPAS